MDRWIGGCLSGERGGKVVCMYISCICVCVCVCVGLGGCGIGAFFGPGK
jgi:hypothetical protein